MSWSATQFEMESAHVPANDNSLITINTALASRRRHVAGLLREQLKNKTRFRPAASITRGRSDFSILDHYRTQGSTPSPMSQSSRVATKSPPPTYRSNLRTTSTDLTRSATTTTTTSTETRHATSATTSQSNLSSETSTRSHLHRSSSHTSLISNERQRYKNSNDETLEEEKTKKSFRERSPTIHEQKSIYGKVEGREERQLKKSPTSVMYQQDSRYCSSPTATVEIDTSPSAHKEIHLPSDKNISKKGLTLEGSYDGTNSLGGNISMNNNNTSISPMVINIPTISTPDDNDTVLTTSTSDQHEDLVKDLSNKFASVGGKEKRGISSPPTISICTNLLPNEAGTQQHTTMPISVRGRAKLYDVQRKVTNLDSGEGANNAKKLLHQKQQQWTVPEEEVLQNCTTSHNSTSDADPNHPRTKKLISVPTYFTPTRCWEVAPKPQPFKPIIQGKCGVAAETSSASCGDDNATRASSSSISGNNEFKERCRERQLEYLKHSAASNSSHYQRKDRTAVSVPDISLDTLPPPPPPTSPPPSLLPTEYYAALSSALKINESLRRRIAYLEKELALTRKIDTRNDTENGLLSRNNETQRSHTPRNEPLHLTPSDE
jgi:hypothetical protein